jgi:hypothetical protein
MIENRQFRIKKVGDISGGDLAEIVEKHLRDRALRWYVSQVTEREVVVEATVTDEASLPAPRRTARPLYPGKSAVLCIVPTGVGCEVGGYAGDATPAVRLLSATADYLITNPNAVNASSFIRLDDNVLYTEGLCIDQMIRGEIDLHVPYANRVGLVIEQASPENLDMVFNLVNAVRSVYGVEIVDCVVTDGPIGSRAVLNGSGAFVGTVDRPEVIESACRELIERGAQAIAITTQIRDLPHDAYVEHFEGRFPNPMGGVEAIISHWIVQNFRLPAAHAPMVNCHGDLALTNQVVDARGAGEMSSQSGLACTLVGLSRAPQIGLESGARIADVVNVHNLLAVVAPASCLGGIPALYAERHAIPIVAVRGNRTVLDVTGRKLGLGHVIEVESYAEAAGILLALRRGLDVRSLVRPLETLRPERSADTRLASAMLPGTSPDPLKAVQVR